MALIILGLPGAVALFAAFNMSETAVRARWIGAVVAGLVAVTLAAIALAADAGNHSPERSAGEIWEAVGFAALAFVLAMATLHGLGLLLTRLHKR